MEHNLPAIFRGAEYEDHPERVYIRARKSPELDALIADMRRLLPADFIWSQSINDKIHEIGINDQSLKNEKSDLANALNLYLEHRGQNTVRAR